MTWVRLPGSSIDGVATTGAIMEMVTIEIRGLLNQDCVRKARSAFCAIPGVQSADVSLANALAKVKYESDKVHLDQFRQAMCAMGFEVHNVILDSRSEPTTR